MNYKQKGLGIICMKWLHVTLVFNVSLSKTFLLTRHPKHMQMKTPELPV